MRVAILILGIIGSLLAISFAACAGAAAGVMSGAGAIAEEAAKEANQANDETKITQIDQEELKENIQDLNEAKGVFGNLAVSAGAQELLGLIGCVMEFIALGKGNKATEGAILLLLAVMASLWAGELPSIGLSNLLQLAAGIMAIIAAPKLAEAA